MTGKESARTALYILWDLLSAAASMAVAFWLRFVVFGGVNPVGGFGYHMLWAALFSPVYVILYALLGIYTPHPQAGYVHEFGRLVLANTVGVMLYIDLIFVFRVVDFSRWLILLHYLLLCFLTGVRGFFAHRRLRRLRAQGRERRRLVIVGDGRAAADCLEKIRREPFTGVEVVGTVGEKALPGVPRLGGYDRLRAVLDSANPDEAVIALDARQGEALGAILRSCDSTGVKLALLPQGYENMASRPFIEPLGGLPLINVRRVPLDNAGWQLIKRIGDIVGSLALIVLTSPIMLAAAVGTKLSSPGPVIFAQERIGKDRKPFRMLKFRSMRVNDRSDSAWTRAGDPRRTAFGAFMRRYSIDELPQLFNVLKGDMSLVGPRPEIPRYVDHFKYSVPLYMVRHRVRPGITGWAQVNGLRGDTSIRDRVDFDLYYIENWSPFFDAKILLMTPFRGIVNRQEPLRSRKEEKP